MEHVFSVDFFVNNRRRLRELFAGSAPVVLAAAGLLQRGADMPFPFYQDASFWYFTGCDEPDVVLVIDKDKEYLIVPGRSASRIAFDGAVDEAALKERSGIETILDERQGWKKLGARLEKVKHVATLPAAPAYIDQLGMYANPARRRLITRMKSYNEHVELLDLSQHITRLRALKQDPELTAIERAIAITAKGLKQALRPAKLPTYTFEYEVEAELTRSFRLQGARGHAFSPIVAGGVRACTLHNEANEGRLAGDELMLVDVGAEYDHYAADITRTVSIGTPSRRQQAVYEAVLEVQDYARSLLVPGTLLKAYEKQVEMFMGEKLRALGLIKTIDHESVRAYYPHAASHFMGLNAHDIGLYEEPLQPGMVLTVEPGIYIRDEAIGVRIEDDVVITGDGNRTLSDMLPKTLA